MSKFALKTDVIQKEINETWLGGGAGVINQRSYQIASPNPYYQICQENIHITEDTLVKMLHDLCLNMCRIYYEARKHKS